jgi:prepilin-type N-terminal cleavage/methylation domain-containing protein
MILHRRPKAARRRRSGFTLVEVLASLVIMGIVLPFAMRGASLAMHAGSVARHQAEAATLGEAKLTEMVSMGSWADTGQGDFGNDFPQYRWSMENIQRDIGVTELNLSVIWQERGEDRSIKLSTYVYVPTGNASTGATQ